MTSTTPSSGDAANEEDLFPGSKNPNSSASVRPHTPQNDHLNASAPGELSPPRSANEPRSSFTNGTYADGAATAMNTAPADKPITDQPGMGWKNKKAQEEMQRAWEFVVDRDFSAKEYGDVCLIGKQQRGEA